MSKLSFDDAIKKLDDMLTKRFDVKVQFVSAQSKTPTDIVYFETVRRNAGAPLIVSYNNMLSPLLVEGSLVGAVRVGQISHLNGADLSRIKETIDLVLEEEFVSKTLSTAPEIEEIEATILPFKRPSDDELASAK